MELVFLGTGAGLPALGRNVASTALNLSAEHGVIWLFDAGEATQHQMARAGLSLHRVTRVFVTHLHGDHLLGLPGLMASRSFQGDAGPLQLYGPPGLAEYVETTLRLTASHLTYPVDIQEVADEQTLACDDGWTVSVRLLDHVIASFGYRLVEPDRPGALQVDKLTALGLPPGPEYARLKRGLTVELSDGRVIDGRDVLGPAQSGRVVALTGDTRACAATVRLAEAADVLVHEATYAAAQADLAETFGHTTTEQAARIGLEAGVAQLLLTHISQRYATDDLACLEAEARQVLPATLVMHDLQTVPVKRRGTVAESASLFPAGPVPRG